MGSLIARRLRVAATAAALLTLAACSSSTAGSPATTAAAGGAGQPTSSSAAPADQYGGGYGSQPAPTSAGAGAAASLATRDTSLGTIVVDGNGMTVYQYDKDTQGAGASTCSGQCASLWPAVRGGTATPQLDGVTGTVATITGTDGQPQLTLNGWPLYYYAGDTAPGDVMGQGIGGIWWVLTPAGERVTG